MTLAQFWINFGNSFRCGCEACACLDTSRLAMRHPKSRRFAPTFRGPCRLAEDKHTPRKNQAGKQKDGGRKPVCAEPLADRAFFSRCRNLFMVAAAFGFLYPAFCQIVALFCPFRQVQNGLPFVGVFFGKSFRSDCDTCACLDTSKAAPSRSACPTLSLISIEAVLFSSDSFWKTLGESCLKTKTNFCILNHGKEKERHGRHSPDTAEWLRMAKQQTDESEVAFREKHGTF